MCDHANDAAARECQCTGYGMGDPPCRCGRGMSLHENGIGRCTIPAARCHEFVVTLVDPFEVTEDHINAAVAAVLRETGDPANDAARRVALAALTAGRESVMQRDRELERVRRHRDLLLEQVAALEAAGSPAEVAVAARPTEPVVRRHKPLSRVRLSAILVTDLLASGIRNWTP